MPLPNPDVIMTIGIFAVLLKEDGHIVDIPECGELQFVAGEDGVIEPLGGLLDIILEFLILEVDEDDITLEWLAVIEYTSLGFPNWP